MSIQNYLGPYMETDDPWKKTLSSQLEEKIAKEANLKNLPFYIKEKNTNQETFRFGKEKAKLYKALKESTAGESNGVIRTFAEQYDYNKRAWWHKALKPHINRSIFLLPLSLEQIAKEAGLQKKLWTLSPEKVMKHSKLKIKNNKEELTAIIYLIKEIITDIFHKEFGTEFTLKESFGTLRVFPNGDQSRIIDIKKNTPLQHVIRKFKPFTDKLEKKIKNEGF